MPAYERLRAPNNPLLQMFPYAFYVAILIKVQRLWRRTVSWLRTRALICKRASRPDERIGESESGGDCDFFLLNTNSSSSHARARASASLLVPRNRSLHYGDGDVRKGMLSRRAEQIIERTRAHVDCEADSCDAWQFLVFFVFALREFLYLFARLRD